MRYKYIDKRGMTPREEKCVLAIAIGLAVFFVVGEIIIITF